MANLSASAPESLVAAFSVNKNLQHAKLEWRYNESFNDPRWAIAYVGAAQLEQAKKAEKRYDANAVAMRAAVDRQTQANAEHARLLQATIRDSSEIVSREMRDVGAAVKESTVEVRGLAAQMTQLAWLQAEQSEMLRHIFDTIREGRANECRQLVEQGERNFRAGFVKEAEERFRLALTYDNTDHTTHQNLGLTYIRLGRPTEALEHFRKALAFPPRTPAREQNFFLARAATHAARTCYATGDYTQAEQFFGQALNADGRNAKNWYDLAVVRAYQRKTAPAIEALQRAFDLDPSLAGVALADDELAGIRGDVENLVVRRTAEMLQDVTAAVTSYAKTEQRLSAVAEACRTTVRGDADVVQVALDATTRGTFPAAHHALRNIRRMTVSLRDETIRALAAARQGAANDASQTESAARRAAADRSAELDRRDTELRDAAYAISRSVIAENVLSFSVMIVFWIIGANLLHGFFTIAFFGVGAGFVAVFLYRYSVRARRKAAEAALKEFRKERPSIERRTTERASDERSRSTARAADIDRYIAEVRALQIP